MKKSGKPTVKATSTNYEIPRFHPLTIVSTPSLVVDADGVAWWVDTEHNSIRKAQVLR